MIVRCAAYNLNLVVNDALKEVNHFLKPSNKFMIFYMNSIKRWNRSSNFISNKEGDSSNSVILKTLNPTRLAEIRCQLDLF